MKLEDMTVEQLIELDAKLCDDPANLNPNKESIFKYTNEIHKKLDKIGMQIFILTTAQKKARGEYVNEDGYTGRKSNR